MLRYLPVVSKVQGAFFNLTKQREALFKFFLGHCSPYSTNVNNPALLLWEESSSDDSRDKISTTLLRDRRVGGVDLLTIAFSLSLFTSSTFVFAPLP